ncbi:Coiled-coil domain-containing protein 189 [Hondaea fermentalgiana]|uniref:Coiled-coil domain-containing protein 189 n=1 Tax=Hondaea fermentalgiana TaxID=2315210 RepID=A0A2R5G8G9_9STRA|nr:Coiled-coil domain-containing protein 189 [Hondaea fermentalgiana]|eukprot:GBG26619.1 Coiled-coil domain-containing protein 189 [Hondaea fermentalgiana]
MLRSIIDLPQLSKSTDTDMIYKDVFLDLLFVSYRFAVDKTWSPAQTSVYVSLMKECVMCSFFEVNESGPLVLEESYRTFAKMVRMHAVPIVGSALFSLPQVVEIIDEASATFFKHYRSYAKTFTKPCLTSTKPVKFKMAIPQRKAALPALEHASNQEVEVYEPQSDVDGAAAPEGSA